MSNLILIFGLEWPTGNGRLRDREALVWAIIAYNSGPDTTVCVCAPKWLINERPGKCHVPGFVGFAAVFSLKLLHALTLALSRASPSGSACLLLGRLFRVTLKDDVPSRVMLSCHSRRSRWPI